MATSTSSPRAPGGSVDRSASRTRRAAGGGRPSAQLLLLFWAALAVLACGWALVEPYAVFLVFGSLASVIVTLPALRAGFSVLSPWSLVMLTVYIGGGLRSVFLSLRIDTPDMQLDRLFFLNQGPDYFVVPSVFYLLGLGLMTFAFMFGPRPAPRSDDPTLFERYRFHRSVLSVASVLALIGFAAFLLYARNAGGFSLAELSQKRSRLTGTEVGDSYSSSGYLLVINQLSAAAFWIVIAHYAGLKRNLTLRTPSTWVTLGFAVNAILLPIYASSRTDAVFTLLVGGGIVLAVNPAAVPLRKVVAGIAAIMVLLGAMTFLRGSGNQEVSRTGAVLDGLTTAVVYNRSFGDMQTASHVINNVPEVIPFQNGRSIAAWVVAPIPRAVWADKPVVNIGPTIGYYIYDTRGSGVPPGFVGDLYLNFGLPGIAVGALLLGRMLRLVENWRRRQHALTPGFMVAYLPVAFSISTTTISKGIGAAAFRSLSTLIPVLMALALAGYWARRTRAGSRTGAADAQPAEASRASR